jgi:hypothetical protein
MVVGVVAGVVDDGLSGGESAGGSFCVAITTRDATNAAAAAATSNTRNLVRPTRYHGAGGALNFQVLVLNGSKVSVVGSGSGMANEPVTSARNGPGSTAANRSVSGSLSDTPPMVGGRQAEPVTLCCVSEGVSDGL